MLFPFCPDCGLLFLLVALCCSGCCLSYIYRGGAVRFFFAGLWPRASVLCILWLGTAPLVINS